jgi:hypothetical protein
MSVPKTKLVYIVLSKLLRRAKSRGAQTRKKVAVSKASTGLPGRRRRQRKKMHHEESDA